MVTPGWEFDPDLNTAFAEGTAGSPPVPDPGYTDFQGGRPLANTGDTP